MELDRPLSHDDLVHLACALRGRGLAWLDGDGSGELGRRSILAFDPIEARVTRVGEQDPLSVVRGLEGGPWIGAFAYDLVWSDPARFGVRSAARLVRDAGAIALFLVRHRVVVTVDHESGRATLETTGPADEVASEIRRALAAARVSVHARAGSLAAEPRAPHRDSIVAALEAIARGDLYQVNLARRWTAELSGDPFALYLAMRAASAVPLGAYLEVPDGSAILSRSMERFLSFDARTREIETRPIKGTVRHDAAGAVGDLRASEKERAEHAMIVDLMRNDLSRVAEPGSVRPKETFRVEPYARLSHLVSIVGGRVREGLGPADILGATLPAGSITGAPKLAAIEHIERLERSPRGFYTGVIGTIGADGSLALSVAIRTAHVRGALVEYFAGGGIVEASDPDAELDETELKAKVLEDAIATL